MTKSVPISLDKTFKQLTFLADRTPKTTEEESSDAFSTLSTYRDGGVFIGHYAGNSQWERHPCGDEFVMVIEGSTTLILLQDDTETHHTLQSNEFLIVPENQWHRFETPTSGVKIMSITPQPTEHRIEQPD